MKSFILAIACATLFVSGCAAGRIDLKETGEIKVDVHHLEALHIEEVAVYQAGGWFEVKGIVRRHQHAAPPKGTIEIKVVDPEGKVLVLDEVEYAVKKRTAFMPRKMILSRTGHEEGVFSKQIKVVLPRGSTVLLTIR